MPRSTRFHVRLQVVLIAGLIGPALASCGEEAEGLAPAAPAVTTVKLDFFHDPLPDIPVPNDLATRYDPTSATGRRINASLIAPSFLSRNTRALLNQLDGWGSFQPINVPFTGPLDVASIRNAHDDPNYDLSDDVIYLVGVDPESEDFGRFYHLDVGNGNYPVILESLDRYGKNDPRGWTLSLVFDEADEDLDGDGVLDPGEDRNHNGMLDPGEDANNNGVLDPPEDTDADGVLDRPNYLPGMSPAREDRAGRADALMTFYERETNTLIARPLVPLRERTTYAVIITRRLLDANGEPVGSPYPSINHTAQNAALAPLPGILAEHAAEIGGLTLDDVAFAFTYTTQSLISFWAPVRDGLYGHGVQGHLGRDFPATLDEVAAIWEPGRGDRDNTHIIYTEEWASLLRLVATQLFGLDESSRSLEAIVDAWSYVDFQVFGSFTSPQLFNRVDEQGEQLDLNDQSWPPDLDRVPVEARPETIHFWITVPRREVSARGEGRPAPVVVMAHSYGANRVELLPYVGFFAKYGFATVSIDSVSHGLDLDEETVDLARLLLDGFGLGPLLDELIEGRAFDQNGDGQVDAGADFWSGYLLHTRDVVRQSQLDHSQLIRILRSFDGQREWAFDLNNDGQNELAGDFDADGIVDLGGDVSYSAIGGSLGGLMSFLMGGLDPAVTAVTPVAGGAGMTDLAMRSHNPGVPEAALMPMMGPLYVGTLDSASSELLIETQVNDLRRLATRPIATVANAMVGDTLVAENLDNGERGCGYVAADGTVRASVESDAGDRHRVRVYRGPALITGSTDCRVLASLTPYAEIDTFEVDIAFQTRMFNAGDPLEALTDGLGLRRASPDLRRLLSFAQLGAEPADPAVYARYLQDEPYTYAGSGETTGANVMVVTTVGDMAVPASSGVTMARAAGLIDYLHDDPRYGVPPNQELIDTYTTEAVHNLARYTYADSDGGVHIDIDNFSQGTDIWGSNVPRLDPPLHLWSDKDLAGEDRSGISGAIFPYGLPEGMHAFPLPGNLSDDAIEDCVDACETGDCGCDELDPFDTGNFLFNALGRHMQSAGETFTVDLCNSRNDCPDFPPLPEPRPLSELRQ